MDPAIPKDCISNDIKKPGSGFEEGMEEAEPKKGGRDDESQDGASYALLPK